MNYSKKTKAELIEELKSANNRLKELEKKDNDADNPFKDSDVPSLIIDNMLDGLAYCKIILDEDNQPVDFRFIAVNEMFEKFTGLNKDVIVGNTVYNSIPGVNNIELNLMEIFTDVALNMTSKRFEFYFEPFDKWYILTAFSPKKNFMVVIFQDISDRVQTLEMLSESRKWLETTIQSMGDGVIATDAKGNVTLMNHIAERLTGWTYPEARGRNVKDIFHIINESTDKKVVVPIDKVLKDKKIQGLANHTILVSKDGNKTPIDDSAAPIKNSQGELVGVVMVFKDISKRRKTEKDLFESRKLLESVIQQAPIPIVIAEPDGNLRYINDACLQFLEIAPSHIIKPGTNLSDMKKTWRDYSVDGKLLTRAELPLIQSLNGKTLKNKEYKIITESGNEKWEIVNAAPIFDDKGNLSAAVAIFPETTVIKQAEKRILESTITLNTVFKVAEDISLILTNIKEDEHIITEFSPGSEKILGYNRDEVIGKSASVLHQPGESNQLAEILETIQQNRQGLSGEKTFLRKDGRGFSALFTAYPLFDSKGNINGGLCIFLDISDRKTMEDQLAESEAKFRTLVENLPGVIFMYDQMTDGTRINRYFGPMLNELLGDKLALDVNRDLDEFFNLIVKEDYLELQERAGKIEPEGGVLDFEYRIQLEEGQIKWLRSIGKTIPIGQLRRWHGLLLDVTDRKKIEEALIESEERLKVIMHTIPDPVTMIRLSTGECTYVNKAFVELIGWKTEEIIGFKAEDINLWADPEQRAEMVNIIKQNGTIDNFEAQFRTRDGSIITGLFSAVLVTFDKITHLISMVRDISDRKRAEQTMKLSEAKLRQIIDLVPHNIFAKDETGKYLLVNKSAAKAIGKHVDDILGYTDENLNYPEEITKRFRKEDLSVIETGKAIHLPDDFVINEKGEKIWLETTKIPFTESGTKEKAVLGIAIDISKRKETELELRESEERFRALVENSPDTIMHIKRNGDITFINTPRHVISGDSDVISTNIYDYIDPEKEHIVSDAINSVFETGKPTRYEIDIKGIDNNYYWYSTRLGPIIKNNEIVAVTFISTDITDSKIATEIIRENEKKFSTVFHLSPVAMSVTKIEDSIFLDINQEFVNLLGYSREELIGKSTIDINIFKYQSARDQIRKEIMSKGYIRDYLLSIKKKDEDIKIGIFSGEAIKINDTMCILSAFNDMTEMKMAEEALKESEATLRTILKAAPVGIGQAKSRILGWTNENLQNMLGYTGAEFFGQSTKMFYVDEEEYHRIGEQHRTDINQNGIAYAETVFKAKDGKLIDVILGTAPIDANDWSKGLVFTVLDITERKKSEKKIRENEQLLRKISENYPNSYISIVNSDFTIGYTSGQEFSKVGLKPENFIGKKLKDVFEVYGTDVYNTVLEEYKKTFGGEEREFGIEANNQHQLYKTVPLPDEKGNIDKILSVAENISYKKEAELALIMSESNYRNTIDSLESLIHVVDKNMNFILTNKTLIHFHNLLDLSTELIGKNLYDVYTFLTDDIKAEYDHVWKTGETLVTEDSNIINNKEINTITNKIPVVMDGTVERIITVIHDISEQKRAQEELQKISKLESVGTLAGGIAHNMKNMLASMSLNIGLAKFNPEKATNYLNKVEKSIDQASALATRFQTFSTGGEPVKKITSVVDIVEEACSMALSGTNVICKNNTDEQYYAETDPRQMNEVFMNLLINARQAMPTGGVVDINYQQIELDKDNVHNLMPGKYLKISIIDHGIGISQKHINNIFDPFFTTKTEGHGLGLSSVHYIIRKHQGAIDVDSVMDKGTTFNIYLPSTEKENDMEQKNSNEIRKGSGYKILYMDDEDFMRENMTDLAEVLEFDITCARDGEEAVNHYKSAIENNATYDAVILDLTIKGGGMQGEETLKELLKIDPDVKAIVFSGHSTKPIVANYKEYGFKGRLDKPITIENLFKVIDSVVAG